MKEQNRLKHNTFWSNKSIKYLFAIQKVFKAVEQMFQKISKISTKLIWEIFTMLPWQVSTV